jgi:hypothetical protein
MMYKVDKFSYVVYVVFVGVSGRRGGVITSVIKQCHISFICHVSQGDARGEGKILPPPVSVPPQQGSAALRPRASQRPVAG